MCSSFFSNSDFSSNFFLPIIFWIVLVIGGLYFVRRYFGLSVQQKPEEKDIYRYSALKILNERYAKGEIDKETFEKMRQDIENNSKY